MKEIELSAGHITQLFVEFEIIKSCNAQLPFGVLSRMKKTIEANKKVSIAIDEGRDVVRRKHISFEENGQPKVVDVTSKIVTMNQEAAAAPKPTKDFEYLISKEDFYAAMDEYAKVIFKIRLFPIPEDVVSKIMLDTRKSNFDLFASLMVQST